MAIEPVAVYWHNEIVGYLDEWDIDMWYVGGKWRSTDSTKTSLFLKILENIQPVNRYEDMNDNFDKRIWVGLDTNSPNALVGLFDGERLETRRTITERPETWEG